MNQATNFRKASPTIYGDTTLFTVCQWNSEVKIECVLRENLYVGELYAVSEDEVEYLGYEHLIDKF